MSDAGGLKRYLVLTISAVALSAAILGGVLWLAVSSGAGPRLTGRPAPVFDLTDQSGRTHHLRDYQGRPIVLAFYPGPDAASLQGLRTVRDTMQQFDRNGVKVFAISQAPTREQAELHAREKLNFPLLWDERGEVRARYGVTADADQDGRAAFIVGPRGKVMQTLYRVDTAREGEQLQMLTECCLSPGRQLLARRLGKPLADFNLPGADGSKAESLYGARPAPATVLLFLSSKCPCSLGYDDRIRELAQDYGGQGVRFVAINASAGETPAEIAAHARRAGFSFPVLRDEGTRIADRLGAQTTPEVFVMDRDRILRYHGRVDDSREAASVRAHDLRNALDALLAGKVPMDPERAAFGCAIARAQ
jgi:peroxiredoxin